MCPPLFIENHEKPAGVIFSITQPDGGLARASRDQPLVTIPNVSFERCTDENVRLPAQNIHSTDQSEVLLLERSINDSSSGGRATLEGSGETLRRAGPHNGRERVI